MPDCPSGSRIKPEVLEDTFWLTIGDLLQQIEDWLPAGVGSFLNNVMQAVAPSYIDLNVMCSQPPPVPPQVGLDEYILSGNWTPIPAWLYEWVLASWQANRWSSFCECNPTTGTGNCPPVAEFGGSVTGSNVQGYKLIQRVAIPHGWSGGTVTRRRGADGIAGNMNHSFLVEDANMGAIRYILLSNNWALASGQTQATTLGTYNQAESDAARYISLWGRPSGSGGQTTTTEYTYSLYMSVTFTGQCKDIELPPPDPPDPPPEPDPPTVPLPPIGPSSCTIDTLCSMLLQVLQLVQNTGELVTFMQRYSLPLRTIPGGSYGSRTAAGSINISALAGIQVVIHSGEQPRVLEGAPLYQWDLGWMSVMSPEGMIEEKRITRMVEVWQPRMIQEATTFGYWLKEGVTAEFIPLYPEPY